MMAKSPRSRLKPVNRWPKGPASWRSRPTARRTGIEVEMALNLIKLCVGCDTVEDLEEWIALRMKERKKRRQPLEHMHTTRMVPKRADEITDGGSLYWVIRGEVMCRQPIID